MLGKFPMPSNTDELSFLGQTLSLLEVRACVARLWAFTLLQRAEVVFGLEHMKECLGDLAKKQTPKDKPPYCLTPVRQEDPML